MSVFEYVMVLVSIIIGLGIARMLEGVLRVLRSGRPYHTYWVHSVWVAITFFEMVGHWAYRWPDYHARVDWTIFELLFFLLPAILLFLAGGLLFPEGEPTDQRAYYFQQRRPFIAVFVALMAAYSMETWWVLEMGMGNRGDVVRAIIVASCVPLMLTSRERVHAVLTVTVLLVILGARLPVLGGGGGHFTG